MELDIERERERNALRRALKDATGRPRLCRSANEIIPVLACGRRVPNSHPFLIITEHCPKRVVDFLIRALADDVEGLIDRLLDEVQAHS
jgi:hypothetical protein